MLRNRGNRTRALIAALGLLTGLAACWAPAELPRHDFGYYAADPTPMRLVELLSGRTNAERIDLTEAALKEAGFTPQGEPVHLETVSTRNLWVELGTGGPLFYFVAHTDRFPESPGANDNASCVAAAVTALRMLKARPPETFRIRFLFPALEEWGLHGTRQHLAQTDDAVMGAVSFDMCGIGDAVGVWDIRAEESDSRIVDALRRAGRKQGIYLAEHGPIARFGSDHLAFREQGVPAVGLTIAPRDDEETLREYVASPNSLKWLIRAFRPSIFQTYHTEDDRPETIETEALDMTTAVMLAVVTELDALAEGEGE